jgi:hypothetical protein
MLDVMIWQEGSERKEGKWEDSKGSLPMVWVREPDNGHRSEEWESEHVLMMLTVLAILVHEIIKLSPYPSLCPSLDIADYVIKGE